MDGRKTIFLGVGRGWRIFRGLPSLLVSREGTVYYQQDTPVVEAADPTLRDEKNPGKVDGVYRG